MTTMLAMNSVMQAILKDAAQDIHTSPVTDIIISGFLVNINNEKALSADRTYRYVATNGWQTITIRDNKGNELSARHYSKKLDEDI